MQKKFIKKLLKDTKILQINSIMIYINHKNLVFLKINRILQHFSRSLKDFSFFFKKNVIIDFFSKCIMIKSSRLEKDKDIEENIIKDVRSLFRLKKLKKETND